MTTKLELQQKLNEDFWISKIGGFVASPVFKKIYGTQAEAGSIYTLPIRADLCRLLEEKTAGKVYNKMLFFNTAVYCWLKRYSGRSQHLIANRPFGIVSDADNLIFLKLDGNRETTVRACLRLVHDELSEGTAKSNYDPDAFAARYFSAFASSPAEFAELGVFYGRAGRPVKHSSYINVCLVFYERPDGSMELQITNKNLLLTAGDLSIFGRQILTILETICLDIDALLHRLDIVPREEKEILTRINDNACDFPPGSVLETFANLVRLFPNRIAVVAGNRLLTYRELDRLSDSVADRLIGITGTRPEELVAVMMGHDYRRITAILGVLKAGAGYVPIKAEFPAKRISYMLQDCKCRTIITEDSLKEKVGELNIESVIFLSGSYEHEPQERIYDKPAIDPAAPFVILYTSGSSGAPKGVLIEHRNMYDRLMGEIRFYDLDEHICTIQTSNYAFDSSLLELFLPFVLGGKLVIPTEQELSDYEQLAELINRNGVTDLQANPNFLRNFMDICVILNIRFSNKFKRIWSGGESLNSALVALIKTNFPGVMLSNHYGPTEGTIDAIVNKDISSFDRNIIGLPIFNMNVFIFDGEMNSQPVNFPGEICVSGTGLARGYLNLPALTAEKFIVHPCDPSIRLYKTGDLGQLLPDGNIEYLGRIDDQIKIRGYRIELGEIENNIQRYAAVSEAIVIAGTDPAGMKYLTAFVIFSGGPDIPGLREFLKAEIPDFMIPSYFTAMDKFPLNPAGKNDRKALSTLAEFSATVGTAICRPANGTEEKLLEIWKVVLIREQISTDSNFFEIGGQSLKATQIMFQVYREFGVKLALRDIFSNPTIRSLAALIFSSEEQAYSGIPFAADRELYEASRAQKRIWTICQDKEMSVAYNMPGAYLLEGAVSKLEFRAAFNAMIDRHEALRTTFVLQEDGLKQKIHEHGREIFYFSLEESHNPCVDSCVMPEGADLIGTFFNAEFDLEKGPLIKGHLIELAPAKFLFLFSIHHIITDEWSLELFIHEFLSLYDRYAEGKGEVPYTKTLQYRDYSEHAVRMTAAFAKQRDYWSKVFSGTLPRLDLPFDNLRTWNFGKEGRVRSVFEPSLRQMAVDVSSEQGATLYITLLTIFKVFLSKICHQEDIIVGTISSGRNIPELESIMGLFVNTLALRSFPNGEKSFLDFYREVKQHVLESFSNQDLEFEEVVRMLKPEREFNRHPLFDVLFEFQHATEMRTPHFTVSPYEYGHWPAAKFDLVVSVTNKEKEISFAWTYNSLLFHEATIGKMAESFRRTALIVLGDPEIVLKKFDLAGEEHSAYCGLHADGIQREIIDENKMFSF